MNKKNSRSLKIIIGLLISAALVCWMAYTIEWHPVWIQLKKMHAWVLIPATGLLVCHFYLRAFRWRVLLPDGDTLPLQLLFDGILIGGFATYLLPLRAGEFVRPFFVTKFGGVPFSKTFASVVIERFFDLAAVLLSFGILVARLPGLPEWVYRGAVSLAALSGVLFCFMVAGSLAPSALARLVAIIVTPLPEKFGRALTRFSQELLEGISVLKDGRRLLLTVILTACVWLSCFLQFYVYLALFDVNASFFMAAVAAVVVSLAVAAPSAPGFVGVYQVGCIAAFSLFHLPEDISAAYSIVTHVHQYIFIIGYGIFVLARYGLKFSELREPAGTVVQG